MTSLRAQIEALTWYDSPGGAVLEAAAVLALIPEHAVLVTPESLAAAFFAQEPHDCDREFHNCAAAILTAIRETS